MLLHIMSLTRNIRRDNPSAAQPDTTGFSLPRVGFLGLGDADFEADAAHGGAVDEGGRGLFAEGLGLAAAAEDLVVGCEGFRGCAEG